MNDLVAQKTKLRTVLTEKRNNIKKNSTKEFNVNTFNKLIINIDFDKIKYVASFISIRSEISTNLLNNKILKLKKTLLLPVIEKKSQELIFKKFNSYKNLKLGKFNIPEPAKDKREVTPQLFFVPCLGFDLCGSRIGYGGGFYDRTFAKLKKLNIKFYTVGFAFDKQKQDKIPIDTYDYKLDFVLTEKRLYTFL